MAEKAVITVSPQQLDLRHQRLRTVTEGAVRRMVSSLERRGQLTPIVVAEDGPRTVLIDGFKRQRAAAALGLAGLLAVAVSSAGALQKAQMYLLNRANGFSLVEEGLLVKELVEREGLKQVDVAVMLDRHKSWVCRRLELVRGLRAEIVEDLRLGLLPGGSAQALARLPAGNQGDVAAAIQRHKLAGKESGQLVDLWLKAKEPGAREFLLKNPPQALRLAGLGEPTAAELGLPPGTWSWFRTARALERAAQALRWRTGRLAAREDMAGCGLLRQALEQAAGECGPALAEARNMLDREAHA